MAGPKKNCKTEDYSSASIVGKYLFLYNFIQFIGWSYIFQRFLKYYIFETADNSTKLWEYVFTPVVIFQLFALLEIVHCIVGFVKANVVITALQILFRIFNTFGVFNLIPSHINTVGVPLTLFAWCGAEITRYSFHIFKEINFIPYFVTWIRYSAFIILIPIGVGGELLGQYIIQSHYSNKWNYTIPKINVTVGYKHLIILMMLSSAQGIFVMYRHMFAQRRKALNLSVKTKLK